MRLLEPFAGSAVVSLVATRALPPRGVLAPYQGGKGRFADRILQAMGIHERPTRVVLTDPGPWGRVWEVLPTRRAEVATLIRAMLEEDAGDLYARLSAAQVPEDGAEYVAAFLALQAIHWRSMAVGEAGHFVVRGFSATHGYGIPHSDGFGEVQPQLPALARKVRRIRLDHVAGHRASALTFDFDPRPGDYAFIDAPYSGTQPYGPHDPTREQVVDLALRLADAGVRVAMSEAEPVRCEPFCRWVKVGEKGKSSGLTDAPRSEWLSLSWSDEQLSWLPP